MALTRAEIELIIKTKREADKAFDDLRKDIEGAGASAATASGRVESFGESAKKSGVLATAAGVAIGVFAERAAVGMLRMAKNAALTAARVESLGNVARFMGDRVGKSASEVNALASALKNQGITTAQSFDTIIQLTQAEIDLSHATGLATVAQDAARISGENSSATLERIIHGITTLNPVVLRNARIMVDLDDAYEQFAEANNLVADSLTEQQKVQATINAVMQEGEKIAGAYGASNETVAGTLQSLVRVQEEAAAAVGEAFLPVLRLAADAATAFLKSVAQYPKTFITLAGVFAAVVVQQKLLNAGWTFGLGPMKSYIRQARLMIATFQAFRVSGLGARAGLAAVGAQAGLTTAALGPLGVAAALAVTAFLAWEFGKWIGEMTGLTDAVQDATEAIFNLRDSSVPVEQQQRIINLALEQGARAGLTYAASLEFLQKRGDELRAGTFKDIVAQNDANAARERAIALTDAIAAAEQQVRDEIRQSGETVAWLSTQLQKNEAVFTEWAKENGISAGTITFLKEQIAAEAEALKASEKAAKEAQEAHEDLVDALRGLGLITREQVNTELDRFADLEAKAVEEGIPFEAVVALLHPQLREVAEAAARAGLDIEALNMAMDRSEGVIADLLPSLSGYAVAINTDVVPSGAKVTRLISEQELEAGLLERALEELGITSQDEYRKMARAAEEHFETIKRNYDRSTPEYTAAWKAMIEAQKKASGELPTFWETDVFPGIARTVGTISSAVEGSFAQMLLGAKGFGEGFMDIWESLKRGVLQIFNDILSAFLNKLLKGMLGALTGQQGAFSAAFGGLFGGGGGATGQGGIPGLGGLFGSGAPGTPGASAGGASFFGSSLFGGILGGAAGGFAGFGLGNQFGTGKGILGGVGSGAATGFAFGGPLGAGIGALGGLIGGIIGGRKNTTLGQRQEFSQGLGFANQDELFEALRKQAGGPEAENLINQALNIIGRKDQAANTKWMEDVIRLFGDAEQKLLMTAQAAAQVQADAQNLGLTWEDMNETVQRTTVEDKIQGLVEAHGRLVEEGFRTDAVLRKEAESVNFLFLKGQELGIEFPEFFRPILEHLIEMGLLLDADGQKVIDLSGIVFGEAGAMKDAIGEVGEEVGGLGGAADEVGRIWGELTGELGEGLENVTKDAQLAGDEIRMAFEDLVEEGFTIPVGFETPGVPEVPGARSPVDGFPAVEGGAAQGIIANRPGLVLFGEGGETELGGPKAFFRDILRSLAAENVNLGADRPATGGGDTFILQMNNPKFLDATDLEQKMERDIVPMFTRLISGNKRGSRTNLQQALGVSTG